MPIIFPVRYQTRRHVPRYFCALNATAKLIIEMESELMDDIKRLGDQMGDVNPMFHVLLQALRLKSSAVEVM